MSDQSNDRPRGSSAPDASNSPQQTPAWGTPAPPPSPHASPQPHPSHSPHATPEAGGPTAPYPTSPPGGYQTASPGPYPDSSAGPWGLYPEGSQAVLAFVLGILGVLVFQPLAPFAWVIADREIRAVDAGLRNPSNRGLAVVGKIMGIIGTIFLILGIVILVVVIILLMRAWTSSSMY
jgi:hypothetical protein